MIFDGWLVVIAFAYFSFQPYIIFFSQQLYNWPQSATTIFAEVLPDWDPKDSTFFTTSMPSTTDPNTQCLPSNQDVFAVHKKNCEPLVLRVWKLSRRLNLLDPNRAKHPLKSLLVIVDNSNFMDKI